MSHFAIGWVRRQFPALQQTVNGFNAAFFDGPGGTQVPDSVVEAISHYLRHSNANVHGMFATSERTDAVLAEAHSAMAEFLHCRPEEIVFGANMTSLTFALSRALGRTWTPGDEVITTVLDHDANVAPWRALEEERGVKVVTVDIHTGDCTLDLDDFARKLNGRTRLVALGAASNAVGTANPVAEMIGMARQCGALTFVDAVHFAPHFPVNVSELGCDFLACSTYKFFGPHVGVLYGKQEHLARLRPFKVRPASEKLPDRWETGTQNHECLAGVTACIAYFRSLAEHHGADRSVDASLRLIAEYEAALGAQLLEGIAGIPQYSLFGMKHSEAGKARTPTIAIRHSRRTPAELAKALGKRGIFTWSGNFYALGLTERLGLESTGGLLRIGLVHYNTREEVDRLIAELRALT